MGACSSCKRENIQWLHTVANFGKSTTSKTRRINTLIKYRKKLLHRLVGILLHRFASISRPPILQTYASVVCPYPKKMKGVHKKVNGTR